MEIFPDLVLAGKGRDVAIQFLVSVARAGADETGQAGVVPLDPIKIITLDG